MFCYSVVLFKRMIIEYVNHIINSLINSSLQIQNIAESNK